MTKETKLKVLEQLRAPGNRGAIAELANRRGCTPYWVTRVLSGDDQDDDLVLMGSQLATELAEEKARKQKVVLENLEQINNIQSQFVTA